MPSRSPRWRAQFAASPSSPTAAPRSALRRPAFWRRADRVIAISVAVRRQLEAGGIPADRIAVIPDGIDLEATSATQPGNILAALGLPSRGRLAVAVSALTEEKGLADLIGAARELADRFPDLHWVVAGAGPLRDDLVARARDAGLAERIHFPGWVEEPLRLLAAAQVCVAPSHAEGLGSTLLDAMALGIPVVATAVGGIPELVPPAAGSLVPAGDPVALAREVALVLASPERARSMGDSGRSLAARFAVRGMAEATLSVYRSLTLAVDSQ